MKYLLDLRRHGPGDTVSVDKSYFMTTQTLDARHARLRPRDWSSSAAGINFWVILGSATFGAICLFIAIVVVTLGYNKYRRPRTPPVDEEKRGLVDSLAPSSQGGSTSKQPTIEHITSDTSRRQKEAAVRQHAAEITFAEEQQPIQTVPKAVPPSHWRNNNQPATAVQWSQPRPLTASTDQQWDMVDPAEYQTRQRTSSTYSPLGSGRKYHSRNNSEVSDSSSYDDSLTMYFDARGPPEDHYTALPPSTAAHRATSRASGRSDSTRPSVSKETTNGYTQSDVEPVSSSPNAYKNGYTKARDNIGPHTFGLSRSYAMGDLNGYANGYAEDYGDEEPSRSYITSPQQPKSFVVNSRPRGVRSPPVVARRPNLGTVREGEITSPISPVPDYPEYMEYMEYMIPEESTEGHAEWQYGRAY